MEKWEIYASNKSSEIILYNRKTKQVLADGDLQFTAGSYMLEVFEIGWTLVGYV